MSFSFFASPKQRLYAKVKLKVADGDCFYTPTIPDQEQDDEQSKRN